MADEILRSRHAFGSIENLQNAIDAGKIDQFDVLFLMDEKDKPQIGWVNRQGEPVIVDTEKVITVDTLPTSGEDGKIYIFNGDGYFWSGTEFINLCKPTDLTELEAKVAKKADLSEVEEKIAEAISSAKTYTDERIDAVLAGTKESYEKTKYEFTDVPVGTIVNYRESEIRIMCPANSEWTKQSVGAGGDPNSYYGTLKTYVPNDDVVGYIEHLGDQVDSEILTNLSIDEHGRKYQSTWLALAKYDETTGTWTYYGNNSSKDKYIGWDYQIDWFDANGVMIASDCIRINLSNENCHSSIEPSYVSNPLKEAKTYTDEQIEAILDCMTIIEF